MIENTSRRDPLTHLAGAWGDPGRYIEEQEAAGQAQLVNSDRLPTKFNDWDLKDPQKAYEDLGFIFGPVDAGDPMFRQAQLPKGWKRQGSDHSMWSYLVDELGRKRVSIFYKAAFYDRDAFMSLTSVGNYAYDVLHGEVEEPIFDGAWCTPAAFVEALRKKRADRVGILEMYQRNASDETDRIDELNSEIARIDELIKHHG
ncbi:hypothetical protein [Micromonospora maritima]|uniref:hypothetical protein n=1 Tax=Micromonospora maritima TaxID=986711 RepID=UPI00157C328B|nr:hypothetical protein [Micromonospora maritima]